MTKIILTGGTGLVGKALLGKLANLNYDLTVLYRKSKSDIPRVSWIQSDLSNFHSECLDVVGTPDILIHNAACTKSGIDVVDQEEIAQVNYAATERLFNWAKTKGVKKIIFTSTLSTIKKPLPKIIDENALIESLHSYGASKLHGEQMLAEISKKFGIQYFILRLSSPIPKAIGDLPDTVIKKWISSALHGNDINVFGDGNRTQDFVSVEDIADAFSLCIANKCDSGIFNIASGTQLSMNEVAELICNRYNCSKKYLGADSNGEDRWNISIEKAIKTIGYNPQYPSESAVRKLIAA